MNRTLLLMAVAAVATSGVKAQSVTYNHDSPKQNQITVMETGTGALSPELYYTLLHNKYKKSAASKNKLSFRTLAGVNLYNQTDEAEAIDSALVKRAEIEALNVADRQIDLAWLAEGDKINAQMERFQRNIDRILLAGGTTDDKERWTEYYHVYQCAIDATKDAYMPNAQRKKEYLVTRNFAASLFRNIKYFTLRKLYLCRKWMQKRLQKTTTTGITLPNFDFLA